MSVVGGGRGSFRRINPQLAQCIESLQLVCQGLNRAPDNWWKNNNLIIAEDHLLTHPGASHDVHRTDSNDTMGNESDSDMENLIDLQSVKRHEGNYEIEDDWHQ